MLTFFLGRCCQLQILYYIWWSLVKLIDRVVERVVTFGAFRSAVSQKVIVLFAGFVCLLNLEALLLSCGRVGFARLSRAASQSLCAAPLEMAARCRWAWAWHSFRAAIGVLSIQISEPPCPHGKLVIMRKCNRLLAPDRFLARVMPSGFSISLLQKFWAPPKIMKVDQNVVQFVKDLHTFLKK